MAKFRKIPEKPVVIEAFRWTGGMDQADDPLWIVEMLKDGRASIIPGTNTCYLDIKTPEGVVTAYRGNWIIKDGKGKVYPCRDDEFRKTYEVVPEPGGALMPLLRVGQKVVVSKDAYFGFIESEFKPTEYRAEITGVDPTDEYGMVYRVRPVGADYNGWWFNADEVTAVPDAAPARETFGTLFRLTNDIDQAIAVRPDRQLGQVRVEYIDYGRENLIPLTPDEADQLSDMLRRAAAEARDGGEMNTKANEVLPTITVDGHDYTPIGLRALFYEREAYKELLERLMAVYPVRTFASVNYVAQMLEHGVMIFDNDEDFHG